MIVEVKDGQYHRLLQTGTASQAGLGAQHSSSEDKNPDMISKQSDGVKSHQKRKKPPKECSPLTLHVL